MYKFTSKKGFGAHFFPILINPNCNFLLVLLVLDCKGAIIPHLVG
jgi:hypothetical protein